MDFLFITCTKANDKKINQKPPCRDCGMEVSLKKSVDSDLGDLDLDLVAELIRLNDTVNDSLVDNDLA